MATDTVPFSAQFRLDWATSALVDATAIVAGRDAAKILGDAI